MVVFGIEVLPFFLLEDFDFSLILQAFGMFAAFTVGPFSLPVVFSKKNLCLSTAKTILCSDVRIPSGRRHLIGRGRRSLTSCNSLHA